MGRRTRKYQNAKIRFGRARRRNMVDARPGLHSCVMVLDGLKPDFNIGKIFRTADAFGIREIHLIGVSFFDPEPASGSVRWLPFFMHDDFVSCYQDLSGRYYQLFTLEPGGSIFLGETILPERVAFIMGHEEFGISFDRHDYPDITALSIPQWGHVQSLNVSVAASIVMYEYVRQHGRPFAEGLPQKPAGLTRR